MIQSVLEVVMLAERTKAPLTFQISYNDVVWYDVFNQEGIEYVMPRVEPLTYITFGLEWTAAVPFFRIRSGTRQQATIQEEERIFRFVVHQ